MSTQKNRSLSKYLPWVIVGVLLLILFSSSNFFTIVVLIAIGSVSLLYKLFANLKIGFELITLVTVIAGMGISSKAGVIVGVVSSGLALTLCMKSAKNPVDTGINMVLAGFVGYLAGTLPFTSIVTMGVFLTIVFDILYVGVRLPLYPNLTNYPMYLLGHWIFNFTLFKALGPLGLSLVA